MALALHPFAIVRLAIYGILLLFSLICLGLAANLTSKTEGHWTFPGFAVAVAVLTMLSLVPMLVIDMIRSGSFISWVAIELAVFGVLWVLWLASAALSTSTFFFTGDCSVWDSYVESLCRQYSALQAFSWLAWLIIKAYIIIVVILAILAMTRGHKRVWLSPASDLSFSPTHTASGEPKIPPPGAYGGAPYGTPSSPGYPPNQYGNTYPQQPMQHGYAPPPPQHQSPPPNVAHV